MKIDSLFGVNVDVVVEILLSLEGGFAVWTGERRRVAVGNQMRLESTENWEDGAADVAGESVAGFVNVLVELKS
jgi:hypothetical protein